MGDAPSDEQLLVAILQHAELGDAPGELREKIAVRVAEIGGCLFCGRPATRLCDYAIGYELGGYAACSRADAAKVGRLDQWSERGLPYADVNTPPHTCDTPLCDVCASKTSMLFGSGERGFVDSIDHCPGHEDCLSVRFANEKQAVMWRKAWRASKVEA